MRGWLLVGLIVAAPLVMADDCNFGLGISDVNTDLRTQQGQTNVGEMALVLMLCAIDAWQPRPVAMPSSLLWDPAFQGSTFTSDPTLLAEIRRQRAADEAYYNASLVAEQQRQSTAISEGFLACVR